MKKRLFQAVVTISLLWILLQWIDVDEIKEIFKDVNYPYLVIALLIATLNRVVMSQKWNMLLHSVGIKLSWWDCLVIYYISSFMGLFLPPTIGADAVRTVMVSKRKHSTVGVLSSILVERFIGLVAVLIFGILGVMLLTIQFAEKSIHFDQLFIASIVLCTFSILIFFLSFAEPFSTWIFKTLARMKQIKSLQFICEKLEKLYRAYLSYKNHRGILALFLLATFAEIFLVVCWTFVVSKAVSAEIPFVYFLCIVPIVSILVRIPISIAGFGIYEGSFAYFFTLLGLSQSQGLAIGILDHFIIIIAFLPGAIFMLFNHNYKLKSSKNHTQTY